MSSWIVSQLHHYQFLKFNLYLSVKLDSLTITSFSFLTNLLKILAILQNRVCCIPTYVRVAFKSRSWRGVLNTTLCDKVCQWLAKGWWFSLGPPVSSPNKTDRHDITEILLRGALNTITLTLFSCYSIFSFLCSVV